MPHLLGEHIMLREYRQEDYQAIRRWVNDEQSVRYLSSTFWFPQSAMDTEAFLNRMMQSSPNGACFVIADRSDESYLGQLDIFSINWKLRCGDIGLIVGCEEKRGHGVGTEALQLLCQYAFETLGLERLQLDVDMENLRARRCYEKAGFVMEGIKRHAFFRDGKFCDLGLMSMLTGEWREKHVSA